MAHQIEKKDKGFSFGGAQKRAPWHFGETADRWTVGDKRLTPMEAALIGWKRQDGKPGIWNPAPIPVWEVDADAMGKIPLSHHIVRDDIAIGQPERYLSKGRGVSPGYSVVTNDSIVAICESLCNGGAVVDSCLSIANGQTVVMSLHLGESADVNGDMIAPYLLVKNVNDGTAALKWARGVVATVCANTLAYNESAATESMRFRHTSGASLALTNCEELIAIASKFFANETTILRRLANCKIADPIAVDWLARVFGDSKRAKKTTDRILELYKGAQIGSGDSAARKGDNAYALANAAIQWIETEAVMNSPTDDTAPTLSDPEKRFNQLFGAQGAGQKKRDRIMSAALALAN